MRFEWTLLSKNVTPDYFVIEEAQTMISRDFNHHGSGETAAVRMSVVLFVGLVVLASVFAVS